MSDIDQRPTGTREIKNILAFLLHYGTWLGCLIIGCGLIFALSSETQTGKSLINAGVALFIFLPVARVILMTIAFIKQRDFIFAIIGTTVLTIIAVSAFASVGLNWHVAG